MSVCENCGGSTVRRDEKGNPLPCCRTGIVPTHERSPESAIGCATPVTLPRIPPGHFDLDTWRLTHRDPPWLKRPDPAETQAVQFPAPLCAPSLPYVVPVGAPSRSACRIVQSISGPHCETHNCSVRDGECVEVVRAGRPSLPNPRSPNIAAWLKGGCMVCGGPERDGKAYAHNACCDRTDHPFARWVTLCDDAEEATPSLPVAAGRDCEHGRLARSCSECGDAEEIGALDAQVDALTSERGRANVEAHLIAVEASSLRAQLAEATARATALEGERDIARASRDGLLERAEAAEDRATALEGEADATGRLLGQVVCLATLDTLAGESVDEPEHAAPAAMLRVVRQRDSLRAKVAALEGEKAQAERLGQSYQDGARVNLDLRRRAEERADQAEAEAATLRYSNERMAGALRLLGVDVLRSAADLVRLTLPEKWEGCLRKNLPDDFEVVAREDVVRIAMALKEKADAALPTEKGGGK